MYLMYTGSIDSIDRPKKNLANPVLQVRVKISHLGTPAFPIFVKK